MKLAEKKCIPCRGEVPALTRSQFEPFLAELKGWAVVDDHKLSKTYKFPNFKEAMELANRIAQVAESENHHPDLLVCWGKLGIELWTHAAGGLTESDFILAAKIDALAV